MAQFGQKGKNGGIWFVLFFAGITLVSGCSFKGDQEPPQKEEPKGLSINWTEPVSRDWAEIKKSGVLRMITSYSSGSYFLHKGIQVGFEYELIRAFASQNDLALEVIIPAQGENPYDLLNSGSGDVIAASYTITEERKAVVNFTRPYNLVDQMVVVSEELGFVPESISQMEGIPISIRRNSSYFPTIKTLQNKGFPISLDLIGDEIDTEAALFQVANGNYMATIADDIFFQASSKYMNGLVKGPIIAERDTIAWAVRKNSPDLENRMNNFLYRHFKFREDGSPKRSAFLNILRKRYFESGRQIADYFSPEERASAYGTISPYDSLIQSVSVEFGIDWVLVTAVAAQESKFDPASQSWAGAIGLMQVLPRFSEISEDSLYIPEVNVREGVRILSEHLRHYEYMDSTNQIAFALATYNSGLGHLADARRLTIDRNDDPSDWDEVSQSLLRLMQRKYYKDARYGFARGIETVRYVNEILNRYNTYLAILALSEEEAGMLRTVFGLKTLN
ncbi:MAG: transporter substrate-binding domain-containing protein [Bacteroidota bacterium]